MHKNSNGSATLPRDFRFRYQDGLSTPEPVSTAEPQQPSPPRQRLKIRRRIVSNLQVPTDQFLASVAAADVPLPTIERTQDSMDFVMPVETREVNTELLVPRARTSLPRTPVPMLSIEPGEQRRPNWYMGATQNNSLHRPSSSHSDDSEMSYDSLDSTRGRGIPSESEDESCTSPEPDCLDPYCFSGLKGDPKQSAEERMFADPQVSSLNAEPQKINRNSAPWSKAQIAHLWSIYLVYLQDPTLTPLRIGTSRVPPEGVCYRVAREARRSWKGTPSVSDSCVSLSHPKHRDRNKSVNPLERSQGTYGRWPHSSSATRNRLRDLCRNGDPNAICRYHHYLQSLATTPLSKPTPSRLSRSSASDLHGNGLDIHDIAISLSLSTAVSMKPDGPLISLTQETKEHSSHSQFEATIPLQYNEIHGFSQNRDRRLGSPFSRSYGPSSSRMHNLPSQFGSLGSPLKFRQSRSLNGTQKRRAQDLLDEELSPIGSVFKPSDLNDHLFGGHLNQLRRVRTRGFSLGDQVRSTRATPLILSVEPSQSELNPSQQSESLRLCASDRPRLRSPFTESGISNTFPRRLFPDHFTTGSKSSNTTMHHTRRSIESFDFRDGRINLPSQLQTLDESFKQIQEDNS